MYANVGIYKNAKNGKTSKKITDFTAYNVENVDYRECVINGDKGNHLIVHIGQNTFYAVNKCIFEVTKKDTEHEHYEVKLYIN